jgi:predicted TIM-barrel enzyme
MSLPSAPLDKHYRYFIVLPRPLLGTAQVIDLGAQADARGAAQVLI